MLFYPHFTDRNTEAQREPVFHVPGLVLHGLLSGSILVSSMGFKDRDPERHGSLLPVLADSTLRGPVLSPAWLPLMIGLSTVRQSVACPAGGRVGLAQLVPVRHKKAGKGYI